MKHDLVFRLSLELNRCNQLFNTQLLENTHILSESVFIELLIRLNDILQQLKEHKLEISFSDHIEEGNITDLINNLRNAACHTSSSNRMAGAIEFNFNRIFGRAPNALQFGTITLGSEFKDDIALFYGKHRIYLKRHLQKLLTEITQTLQELSRQSDQHS